MNKEPLYTLPLYINELSKPDDCLESMEVKNYRAKFTKDGSTLIAYQCKICGFELPLKDIIHECGWRYKVKNLSTKLHPQHPVKLYIND
jgi:hypothetical protein